jgi:nickel/cobalt transporter (NiCoT) family protein
MVTHVTNPGVFIASMTPLMIFFGMRHALDVDHITAIDNLVRMHNVRKSARWVGTGFSLGHSASVFIELVIIIYVVGSATGGAIDTLSFWGGVVGAVALGVIGVINFISMKKWGKTGTAILAGKVVGRTRFLGPMGSAMITGLIFGFGFDTATQISALTISAVASATAGIEIAMTLAVIFAMGMIFVDSMDGIFVRSAFSKILSTKIFKYMSYALSAVALTVATAEMYSTIYNVDIPEWIGAVLAVGIIGISFGYGYLTRHRRVGETFSFSKGANPNTPTPDHSHHDVPSSMDGSTKQEKFGIFGKAKEDTESR